MPAVEDDGHRQDSGVLVRSGITKNWKKIAVEHFVDFLQSQFKKNGAEDSKQETNVVKMGPETVKKSGLMVKIEFDIVESQHVRTLP